MTFIGYLTGWILRGDKRHSKSPGEAEVSDAASGWNPADSKGKTQSKHTHRPAPDRHGNRHFTWTQVETLFPRRPRWMAKFHGRRTKQ